MWRAIARTYRQAFVGLPREVWILSVVFFVNRSGTMVLPFLALYCTNELGLPVSAAGGVLSAYGLGAIVGTYAGGKLSSVVGARRMLAVSLFVSAPLYWVVLLGDTFLELAVFMFLVSIATESFRPASVTATTELCPPELHPRALALNRLAINLAMSIGPAAGGFLASVSYALIFWIDGATCLVSGIAFLGFFGWRAGTPSEASSEGEPGVTSARSPLRDLHFVLALLLLLLSAIIFFQTMSTYPIYLRDFYGFNESEFGLLVAVNTLLIVLLEMVLVHKVERFNQLRVIAWGSFLTCFGFGILPLGAGTAFCLLSVVIWTFGEMLSMPLTAAYVAGRATSRNRGLYMGYYTMCFSLASVVAPAMGTALYEVNPDLIWYCGLVVAVLALVGYYLLARAGGAAPAPHSPTA